MGRDRCRRGSSTTRTCWRRGPAQRGRPLPLLDDGGDRRRPRHPPPRLPRGDRELAARLQHRDDRAHGQRVPGRRGAHRRQAQVEPPRGDGDRPLPARAPPRDPRGPRRAPARAGGRPDGRGQPARARSTSRPGRCRGRCASCSARRARASRRRPAEVCDGTFSIAQFGSTRSINASAAAAIAMHSWISQVRRPRRPPGAARASVSQVASGRVRERHRMNRSPAFQPGSLGGCQKPPALPVSSLQRVRAAAV